MERTKYYYIYILTNKKDGVLYTGVTNEIIRRVLEHRLKIKTGFAEKYFLNHLVYYEVYDYADAEIKREKQIEHWEREWKIALIEKENKEWKDLLSDIATDEQIKLVKEVIMENKEYYEK